jgi:hypothetical protein
MPPPTLRFINAFLAFGSAFFLCDHDGRKSYFDGTLVFAERMLVLQKRLLD